MPTSLKVLFKTQQHKSAAIDNSSGNILMESTAVLQHRICWTEYCNGLHSYELLHPDTSLLQMNRTPTREVESLLMMREDVVQAAHSLVKARKSPRVHNIPFQLLGGNYNSPDSVRPEDLQDKGKAEGVDTIACHTLTKGSQPQTMSKLSYHQPNKPSWQDHAPNYPQPSEDQGSRTASRRTHRF